MKLPALGDIPQLQALLMSWRQKVDIRPVLVAVFDQGLICCWEDVNGWVQRGCSWPPGSCQEGVPLQREAIADLLADLLLDCDVIGAQIVLCLPLAAARWCVLEGMPPDQIQGLTDPRPLLSDSSWSDDLQDCYLALDSCCGLVVATSVARTLLQGWVEVVEMADLPLRRVDWCLTAAHRALLRLTEDWIGNLAWFILDGTDGRLVLIRDGVADLDFALSLSTLPAAMTSIRERVNAWRDRMPSSVPLGWWLSVKAEEQTDWLALVDSDAGEVLLDQTLPWCPRDWDGDTDQLPLSPLQQLALTALQQEL